MHLDRSVVLLLAALAFGLCGGSKQVQTSAFLTVVESLPGGMESRAATLAAQGDLYCAESFNTPNSIDNGLCDDGDGGTTCRWSPSDANDGSGFECLGSSGWTAWADTVGTHTKLEPPPAVPATSTGILFAGVNLSHEETNIEHLETPIGASDYTCTRFYMSYATDFAGDLGIANGCSSVKFHQWATSAGGVIGVSAHPSPPAFNANFFRQPTTDNYMGGGSYVANCTTPKWCRVEHRIRGDFASGTNVSVEAWVTDIETGFTVTGSMGPDALLTSNLGPGLAPFFPHFHRQSDRITQCENAGGGSACTGCIGKRWFLHAVMAKCSATTRIGSTTEMEGADGCTGKCP